MVTIRLIAGAARATASFLLVQWVVLFDDWLAREVMMGIVAAQEMKKGGRHRCRSAKGRDQRGVAAGSDDDRASMSAI